MKGNSNRSFVKGEKMKNREKFELECTDYLNKSYGNFFYHLGFSDSTISDIKFDNGQNSFFIEVKMKSAQSGQFVLIPNFEKKQFEFSPRNKSQIDENVKIIINNMNKNFELYANSGTGGLEINLPKNVFAGWITDTYQKRGVKFFITKGRDYIIFPISKYQDYFNISCKFRIKRSGSSNIPKYLQTDALKKIKAEDPNCIVKKSFEIESFKDLDKFSFTIGENNFILREKSPNLYRVRKLSNTKNANVIFNINLVKEQDKEDLKAFVDAIN